VTIKDTQNAMVRNISCNYGTVCFPHSFDTKNVISQFYKDNYVIYPENVVTKENKLHTTDAN